MEIVWSAESDKFLFQRLGGLKMVSVYQFRKIRKNKEYIFHKYNDTLKEVIFLVSMKMCYDPGIGAQ